MNISPYQTTEENAICDYMYSGEKYQIVSRVYTNNDADIRVLCGYFKNIPNETNDFDGYYSLQVDDGNEDRIIYPPSGAYKKSSPQRADFYITVDGKTVRCQIEQLIFENDDPIIPLSGIYLGATELLFNFSTTPSIHSPDDDGGVGQNSIFYIVDNLLRTYNFVQEHSINLKNENNSLSIPFSSAPGLKITHIENLSFSSEELSTTDTAYSDGDIITSSKAAPKEIEILIEPPLNNIDTAVSLVFSEFYKKGAFLEWKTTRFVDDWYSKNWKLKGIIKEINVPRFSEAVEISLVLYCSNPFWQGESVSISCGVGGLVGFGANNANTFFFRTKSHDTGIILQLTTDGEMGGYGNIPKNSNFKFRLYTYNDIASKTGRTLLQTMQFNGTYGTVTGEFASMTANYNIEISTVFKNKYAKEKITDTNIIDDMTRASEFFTINSKVCEIDFDDLFSSESMHYNPYVTISYTPLYIG